MTVGVETNRVPEYTLVFEEATADLFVVTLKQDWQPLGKLQFNRRTLRAIIEMFLPEVERYK